MAREQANEGLGKPIEYDPDFDGPLKKRSCTDILCLLVFIIFIAGWGAVGYWAIKNGDPSTLLVPRDSMGLRCGIDEEVKNKKYLFFFDLTQCLSPATPFLGCPTTQVCVENCPTVEFYPGKDPSVALPFCKYDYRQGPYNTENCPTWFIPSEQLFHRCVYNVADRKKLRWNVAFIEGDEVSRLKNYLDPVHLWVSLAVHNAITFVKDDPTAHEFAEKIIEDVRAVWIQIVIGIALSLLACFLYVLMLRWLAGVIVWISILGGVAGLGAGSYFSYINWQFWKSTYETDGESTSKTKRDVLLGLFIVVTIVLIIVLLILIVLRKRIALASALIREGSKAVSSVTAVLFFPIFPWIAQLAVFVYVVSVGIFLATTGRPIYQYRNLTADCRAESGWTVNTECFLTNFTTARFPSCSQATCRFGGISNEVFYPYVQGYNIFCFFWLFCFVPALGQMVLAQVFAQWYWTFQKRTLPFFALTAALYRTIRYHLGTLAFGSLIIAICKMIRLCLEYIDRKLKKYDNELTKAIMCCLKCFFWCLEKFLKFINKNAYIMCAIHGKNFCGSAKDAFMLLMRNILRVFVLDKVTDFVFFLSKILVSVGTGAVAYIFFVTEYIPFMREFNVKMTYPLVPVVLIMVATYLIATLFFSVYSMAVDTLFLCFLEDCERNNGKERPYYMSRNLMKIFGKKNKMLKED